MILRMAPRSVCRRLGGRSMSRCRLLPIPICSMPDTVICMATFWLLFLIFWCLLGAIVGYAIGRTKGAELLGDGSAYYSVGSVGSSLP